MTFEELNLNKPLLSAIEDLGYIHPTPIQVKAFPIIMSGKDMIGIAQTGTGKTFAYLLPILRQLKYSDQRSPRVLIVVPTRELVLQITKEIQKLTTYTSLRFLPLYGGANIGIQKQQVYNGVDIIVATPGRLVDLVITGILRLKDVKQLVIDEVDQMMSFGFRQQLNQFLEKLPEKRQNLMFSATLTEEVETIIASLFTLPDKIEIEAHGTPLEKIVQRSFHVPNINTKLNLLEYILKNEPDTTKVLVFAGTKKLADYLNLQLKQRFPDQVGVIHSNLSQNTRINNLRKFHEGENRVLIATDIVARGLDITDVSHVVNFDTPDTPEDYIHRIGRTGRANKDGVAITFINEAEKEYIEAIESMMNMTIPLEPMSESVYVSKMLLEDEVIKVAIKVKRPSKSTFVSGPAFHEKKLKNQKVNLGGPGKIRRDAGKVSKGRGARRRK